MKRRICSLAVVVVVLGCAAAARAQHHADSGTFERLIFPAVGGLEGSAMRFFWNPEYPPGTVHYSIDSSCGRRDGLIGAFGSNRVALRKIRLTGLDTGAQIKLPPFVGQLSDGAVSFAAVVPELAGLAGESAVLVEAKIVVRNELDGWFRCRLGIIESGLLPGRATSPAPRRL